MSLIEILKSVDLCKNIIGKW